MPFVLFTGWILETVEANPAAPVSLGHAGLLLALGFAFFLGIFPFHTWMPMLAEQAHPYVVAFVFFVLSLVIPLFGLGLLNTYGGLRLSEGLAPALRVAGVLMVITGGVWAAFQRHLARMLGYGMMVQIGFSLLAASLALGLDGNPALLGVMFMLLLPRGLGLAVWALALATIAVHQPQGIDDLELLRFRNVQGVARRLPVAAGMFLVAQFSLAGFPLLAGFPALLILWQEFAARSFPLAAAAFLGSLGLFVGGLRALAVLIMGQDEQPWQVTETWSERFLLVLGGIALLLVGLFPNAFLPSLARMTGIFTNLMK
jgi:formate hydrogenlyase subunit 3/multisubunit Na+/H+ antiporter MnhD subunit